MKYEIRESTELVGTASKPCLRVVALRDIPSLGVTKGTEGGVVSGPHNLSQSGNCWPAKGTRITGNAVLREDARLIDFAVMRDDSVAEGTSVIGGATIVADKAVIGRAAKVGGIRAKRDPLQYALPAGMEARSVEQADTCFIGGTAQVFGTVQDDAIVTDAARVEDTGLVLESAHVGGTVSVAGTVRGTVVLIGSQVVAKGETVAKSPPLADDDIPEFVPRSI